MRPTPSCRDERETEILRRLEAVQTRLREPAAPDRDELRRLARSLVELVEELRRGRAES